MDRNSFILVSL